MKPPLTAFLLLIFCQLGAQDAPDWNPTPTPSSGTIVAQILVDGLWAPPGATLAAFDPQGHCAGSTILFAEGQVTYSTLTVYGDDTTTPEDEGMNGTEPFSLQLFLPATGSTLTWFGPDGGHQLSGWTNTNGAPMPGYDDPQAVLAFHSNSNLTCASDVDGDGLVAVTDLIALLGDFGLACQDLNN